LRAKERSGLITLTTDFGLEDVFVGVMKGVIAGINPEARVVDLTHSISPCDVVEAAFKLRQGYPYFPKGTVHVAVVDPGVGSERQIVAMESDGHLFLAPDNGVLAVVADEKGHAGLVAVTERRYFLPEVSGTFHGRDIFAPVAARLAAGGRLSELGSPLERLTPLDIPKPALHADGSLHGVVLWSDHFGNLITNISATVLAEHFQLDQVRIRVAGRTIERLSRTYAQAPAGELLAIVGAFGAVEIAVNRGNASKMLKAGRGAAVRVFARPAAE